jgi:MFS family permease
LRLPIARQLLAIGLLARLPMGMLGLAIVLHVVRTGGSYAAAGASTAAVTVAGGVGGLLWSRLIDRRGPAAALVAAAALFVPAGLIVAAVRGDGPTALLLGASALVGLSLPPITIIARTVWPSILGRGPLLETVYAVESTLFEVVYIAGPLVVALTAVVGSPRVAVVVATVVGAIGAVAYAARPAVRAQRRTAEEAGLVRARLTPAVWWLAALFGLVVATLSATDVAVVARAGAGASASLLIAVWSAGSLLGGLVYGAVGWHGSAIRRLVAILAGLAGTTAALAAARPVWSLVVLLVVAGAGIAPAMTCLSVLVEQVAPAGAVARAFGLVGAGSMAGSSIGSAAGGWVVDAAGAGATFLVAAAVVMAASGLAAVGARSAADAPAQAAPVPPPAVAARVAP